MKSESKPLRRGDIQTLNIETLAVGGKGVARFQGMVVFVADVAPGDQVEVEVTLVKKSFAEARLRRVIQASLQRRVPPCPVAGVCGGCNWQHLEYSEQLRAKRQLVFDSLRKFSGFELDLEDVRPVIASPKEFRYRNRIQLHHSGPRIGFFKRNSHDIIDIDDCPITDECLAREIPRLRKELAHQPQSRLEIYLDIKGQIGRRSKTVTTDGAGPAFSQVNTEQNENLVRAVLDAAREHQTDFIYDLYAGSGNFTFPLAAQYEKAQIVAVELNSESVQNARVMADAYEGRVRFEEASVDDFIQHTSIEESALVLLDPPRTGCGTNVTEALAAKRPGRILYVSCHPATLARDLRPLKDAGYRLEAVQPFDMFPQTDHVETFVQLHRV